MSTWVLGISGSHNGAYCLLENEQIRVAIQEERLVGVKRARVYGGRRGVGLQYCLSTAGITVADLSMVVLASQRAASEEQNDLWLNPDLRGLVNLPRRVVSHHLAHAASAVATSGFRRAAVMVVDGLGSPVVDLNQEARAALLEPHAEHWEHLSLYRACDGTITPLEVHAAAKWLERRDSGMWDFFSLGGLYAAVAQQIFGDLNHAGKVMGLAPYGEARIPAAEFVRCAGNRLSFPNLVQRRFPFVECWPEHERDYRDLAASAQRALEDMLLAFASRLHALTGESDLCLAGGVALNSVANQRICTESEFRRVHIVPAAEDSGVAIGAAYLGLWELGGRAPAQPVRTDAYGRTASSAEVASALRAAPGVCGARPANLLDEVAERLSAGQIGGWYQGGAELGPRALGQRSILCSPCRADGKEVVNARVKFREPFRPFAPSVLAEHAQEWFDFGRSDPSSPFMLRVVPFLAPQRKRVPAVVHVDGTGRVQTLTAADNGCFYELVRHFHAKTGVPMLLNTSLNVRGEPIAESPEDALWCLLGTGLDFCVINDTLITKSAERRALLDFIPALIARRYLLRLDVAEGALKTSVHGDDSVVFCVATRWGDARVVLPPRLLPLAALINGRRDGHELKRLAAERSLPLRVETDLLLLRRMHIIELRDHVDAN